MRVGSRTQHSQGLSERYSNFAPTRLLPRTPCSRRRLEYARLRSAGWIGGRCHRRAPVAGDTRSRGQSAHGPDVALFEFVPADVRPVPARHLKIAVEVISPSPVKTDRLEKMSEYAAAGIPWYWLVSVSDTDVTSEAGFQAAG
ncbi:MULTISPECIES: Uma2 family endonuclease [Nocardia]|uniref:Uma2 family endonuclease n=1 Tax=Nocardia TaxID=1817 RepID=UPI00292D7BFC|nr:Uma2 family endonuclease [Nocardia canadensis]